MTRTLSQAIPTASLARDSTRSRATSSPLLRGMMLWLLYAIPVTTTVRPVGEPVFDPDIWWHLRVGQWVVENGTVTTTDPFSQIGAHRSWVAYSWLYEVLVYGLYQAFGLGGVVLYRTLMALAIVASVHALVCRLEKRFLVSTALTGAAVLGLAMLFSERPWLFTLLFGTWTLHAVVALREQETPPRWIWMLPVVFVVWANVHIQFIYGLLLLGLACVAPVLDRRLGWRSADESASWPGTSRWKQLVLLFLLCCLATFVNPYHARLYDVVFEYATQPGPYVWLNELQALTFREPSDWMMLALTLLACYALGRRVPSSFEILLLAGTALLAFRARRDLWLVVLADLVILASAGRRQLVMEEPYRLGLVGKVMLVMGLALVAGLRERQQDLSPAGLEARVKRRFPVGAVRHIEEKGHPGPLFNDFNWGGYLIWALPRLPVALDGRTNLYGDARIERFGRVWSGLPGWQEDRDLRAARVIIAPADSPLVSLLRMDPEYDETYYDAVASVFVPVGSKP